MKKVEKMLQDYQSNLDQIKTLKSDRAAMIKAGKVDKQTIEAVKTIDVKSEILLAKNENLKIAMSDAVVPEAEKEISGLSDQLSKLSEKKSRAKRDYLEAMAHAVAKREAMSFETRNSYDSRNGAVTEIKCPNLNFDAAMLDSEEKSFFADAVADARKEFSPGQPIDRQIENVRAEIGKYQKLIAKEPIDYIENLLKKFDPVEEVEPVPGPRRTTARTIDYDKISVNYNTKH